MMQEKRTEQGYFVNKETMKVAHSEDNIREIIQTIENYLNRTKESIERVEKFVQELKEETKEFRERENGRINGENIYHEREQDSQSISL